MEARSARAKSTQRTRLSLAALLHEIRAELGAKAPNQAGLIWEGEPTELSKTAKCGCMAGETVGRAWRTLARSRAGARRLECCRDAGWRTMSVVVRSAARSRWPRCAIRARGVCRLAFMQVTAAMVAWGMCGRAADA